MHHLGQNVKLLEVKPTSMWRLTPIIFYEASFNPCKDSGYELAYDQTG